MEDGCRRSGCRLGGPSGPARPLLPSLLPSGSKWALARPPWCRGWKRWVQRATPGVTASSSGGGSTCLAWNGSDGRNSGGRDAPLPGLLGGSWVGRGGMSNRCTEAGVGRGAPRGACLPRLRQALSLSPSGYSPRGRGAGGASKESQRAWTYEARHLSEPLPLQRIAMGWVRRG